MSLSVHVAVCTHALPQLESQLFTNAPELVSWRRRCSRVSAGEEGSRGGGGKEEPAGQGVMAA